MPNFFAMGSGQPTVSKDPVTEPDPFTNLYDDGSVEHRSFNTMEEAVAYIPEKWRPTTKTMRESELPTPVPV